MLIMEKKFILDMDTEELEKVFNANEKLRNDILDDMIETEMHYISEQLDYFRHSLSDWSIGTSQRNYMIVNDYASFINGVEKVEKAIPILIDSDKPVLEEAVKAVEEYRSANMYTDEFEDIEINLTCMARNLADAVVHRFNQTLDGCFKEEYQLDYFIEFYSDARLDDNCYIDTPDYILKEDITKTYN